MSRIRPEGSSGSLRCWLTYAEAHSARLVKKAETAFSSTASEVKNPRWWRSWRIVSSLLVSVETAEGTTHLCSSPSSPERLRSWSKISLQIIWCAAIRGFSRALQRLWMGRRSTLGPRWVNRGSPIFGGQPWVPAQKSSTVGPHDQFSLLRALGNQTKLSTFDTVAFRVRRRPDRFHALRRSPPLHSPCQKFGNTDYFLKIPAKAKIRCSMKHGRQPSNQLRGAHDAAHTCVRQVFRRGIY